MLSQKELMNHSLHFVIFHKTKRNEIRLALFLLVFFLQRFLVQCFNAYLRKILIIGGKTLAWITTAWRLRKEWIILFSKHQVGTGQQLLNQLLGNGRQLFVQTGVWNVLRKPRWRRQCGILLSIGFAESKYVRWCETTVHIINFPAPERHIINGLYLSLGQPYA